MIERVLDWRNRRAWLTAIPRYASQILSPSVREHVEAERPNCWADDLRWLPNHGELESAFSERLWSHYSHVKTFHGCRPTSLASYFDKGVQGQDPGRIVQTFREIYADVPASAVNRAIEVMRARRADERGSIWLAANDRKMIEGFGHYIISGSEYLLALAAHIEVDYPWAEDYRLRLRDVDIPTILEIDVPVELISKQDKLAGARVILSNWGQLRARRPVGGASPPSYRLMHDIPPSCIKAHYHPSRIKDMHTEYGLFVNKELACDICRG
jgi:hypothetical protein